ncbi:MAG: tetratricopeptide repeat protein, partial [Elainellaceae cyanobacterium]
MLFNRLAARKGLRKAPRSQTLAAYDDALQRLGDPMSAEAADLWRQRGYLLRQLKQPQLARDSFEQALAIEPEHGPTLSAQGTVLAMLGQRRAALDYCDRGLLEPSADGFNARGLARLIFRQFPQAIADFDQAIALDPEFSKAWHNRSIALARLGKDKDALESAERSLALNPQPAVHALAAYLLLKRGQFRGVLAHCEKIWAVQPNSYPAALYGVVSIAASGQLTYLTQAQRRRQLVNALRVLLLRIRYRLLALVALLSLLLLAPAGWSAPLRTWGAKLFSVGIIALMVADLWRQRQRLGLIWTVYFRCGLLTYLRAAGTIAITIGAFLLAYRVFPPFMRWGWSSLIFGQPSNIIFQPFNLLSKGGAGLTHAGLTHMGRRAEQLVGQIVPWAGLRLGAVLSGEAISGEAISGEAIAAIPWAALFIAGFWLLLLLGIPFWARLEEHIFRR